jgi:hypothetical protein
MLFIVSDVKLAADDGDHALEVTVEKAQGEKCPRCWRIVATVEATGLCDRCTGALKQQEKVGTPG